MAERMVTCAKFGQDLPGLEKPPMRGEIGQKIFEKVSKKAWDLWRNDMQLKVINEYRLNPGDSRDYQVVMDQMMKFLNLTEGSVVEVENAARGKGQS